jgi:serine/threonine-protein phosphatase 2B catalytic subunit
MDNEDGHAAGTSLEEQRNMQVEKALQAIKNKGPIPEIDFTIHTMEDGTQVSTQERICKGRFALR